MFNYPFPQKNNQNLTRKRDGKKKSKPLAKKGKEKDKSGLFGSNKKDDREKSKPPGQEGKRKGQVRMV